MVSKLGRQCVLIACGLGLFGCQTVVLTAANVMAPVLVGPIQPKLRRGDTVQKTRVERRASAVVSASQAGSAGGTTPYQTDSSFHKDEAAVFDVALIRPMGTCLGCWSSVAEIEFSTLFALWVVMIVDGAEIGMHSDVVHLIGEAMP